MNAPDLTTYRLVHRALRSAADRLATATADLDPADEPRIRALVRYWNGLVGEIVTHHTTEDDFFFPALAQKVPVVASTLATTDTDHRELDELMADGSTAFARLATGPDVGARDRVAAVTAAIARHLREHLDLEDAELLPMFERHFTGDEYEELEEHAMKSLGISKQALFTVPFVLAVATPAERAAALGAAPGAFRLLYRLTRRRFARLERAALGAATVATEPVAA